jgi:hypothetical protein
MGIYNVYLNKGMSFILLSNARKEQLKNIASPRRQSEANKIQ